MPRWIRDLLMLIGLRSARPRKAENDRLDRIVDAVDGVAAAVRAQTKENTLQTDRQIDQLIQSAARKADRVEARAVRSADVTRRAAEQALHLLDPAFTGRFRR